MTTPSSLPPVALAYVIFYVADVSKTVTFWQEAFGLSIQFNHESGEYAELSTGQTTLGFVADSLMQRQGVQYRPNQATERPAGGQLSFTHSNPEQLMGQALARGATLVKPLERKPWGQLSGFLRDENGILVEICSKIEHR